MPWGPPHKRCGGAGPAVGPSGSHTEINISHALAHNYKYFTARHIGGAAGLALLQRW